MTQSDVKFSYHPVFFPEYQGHHVLTLARKVEGKIVTCGWSICFPGKWVPFEGYVSKMERDTEASSIVYSDKMAKVDETLKVGDKVAHPPHITLYHGRTRHAKVKGLRLEKGDLFSKAKGRDLALKRLNESPICLERNEGEHAIDAILRFLSRKDDITYLADHTLLRDMAVSSANRRKAINNAKSQVTRATDKTTPYKLDSRPAPPGFFSAVKEFFFGVDDQ